MPFPKFIPILIAQILCASFCFADSLPNIVFNKVLPQEGKTFGHVTGMVQDKHGYMWLASKNGLFRYDGYQMLSFKNDPSDSNTISTDALEGIAVDKKGFLWIATFGKGVERFDPVEGIFTHFQYNEK